MAHQYSLLSNDRMQRQGRYLARTQYIWSRRDERGEVDRNNHKMLLCHPEMPSTGPLQPGPGTVLVSRQTVLGRWGYAEALTTFAACLLGWQLRGSMLQLR